MADTAGVGIVVIGRNEGKRLIDCLTSLGPHLNRTIYVDSGSSDGSVEAAETLGARTLHLDMSVGFTAARARNEGYRALVSLWPDVTFIQFVDGDCQVDVGWLETAVSFLEDSPDVAVVCGRRRELHPDATIYNRLCDREWDTPVGETTACGGDALMRRDALEKVGGYDFELIAGEEPELCLRLRREGYKIWRADAEMTRHDADIRRFGQWWRRAVRAGHAFAEVSWMYRTSADRIWSRNVRRAVLWTGIVPAAIVLAALAGPVGLVLLLAYPAQIIRLAFKEGWLDIRSWKAAFLSVAGKFAECVGIAKYHANRFRARRGGLIEYKR